MFPEGLGDLGGIVKQAKQMKGKMEELKAQLADETIEAGAGGGMVNITVNGKMEVLAVKIDPEVIDKEEAEMLETLVRAAVNEALVKVQAMVKEKMTELTGGIDIPGVTS